MTSVKIIGAGITGLTTAYYLNKLGMQTTVMDREPDVAMQCSYANGGQVSVSNSEVWNTWENVFKGVRWMFKKDAPLLVRPSLDPHKISWLVKFLYHTAKGSYEKNTLETIAMGLNAQAKYDEMIAEHKIKFDRQDGGILHIYRDIHEWEAAKKAGYLYEQMGVMWKPHGWLETREITNNNRFLYSIETKSDWTGDVFKFCQQLKKVLKEQGTLFDMGYYGEVESKCYLLTGYDYVVVCAGTGSKKIGKMIGDNLPIYPVKGYSVTIEEMTGFGSASLPSYSILDNDAKIVTSTLGNKLRIAGTAELAGHNYDIRKERIDPLLKWAQKNLGVVATKYSSWACLRPMTPNMMPIVKQSSKNPRVFYNTGHGHLGWTLAPHTADIISRKIYAYDKIQKGNLI